MATTGDNQSDAERTLHIRFKRSNTEQIEETLRTFDTDGTPEPYFECTFHNPDQLHQVTRPKNLELLRVIARKEPASIRETARLVDRDVRQVHQNLSELESLGLIDFVTEENAKRPQVWYDSIEVDLPLFDTQSECDAADT